jgi:copper chaperone CopZ
MRTATFQVTGMTCDHCARAVRAELRALPGVVGVSVDVAGGVVTVRAHEEPDVAAVRAAVAEAGYELADVTASGRTG